MKIITTGVGVVSFWKDTNKRLSLGKRTGVERMLGRDLSFTFFCTI